VVPSDGVAEGCRSCFGKDEVGDETGGNSEERNTKTTRSSSDLDWSRSNVLWCSFVLK